MVRILVLLEQVNISSFFRGGFVHKHKSAYFFCELSSITRCRGPPNLNFQKFKFRRKIMKKFKFKGKKLCDYIVYTDDKNKHIAILLKKLLLWKKEKKRINRTNLIGI